MTIKSDNLHVNCVNLFVTQSIEPPKGNWCWRNMQMSRMFVDGLENDREEWQWQSALSWRENQFEIKKWRKRVKKKQQIEKNLLEKSCFEKK